MNSKGIVAIKDTSVCMKCLKNKATHTYTIYGRGYGSSFDMSDTKFQCCDDCDKPEYEEWFNETEVMDDYVETYQHEEKILDLIKNLPLEGQELFENRFDSDGYHMDAQDWIDYQLGILSHKKCKKYGMHSFDEQRAYEERFPTCQHPIEIDYRDSIGCHCPFGAFGKSEDGVVFAEDDMLNDCYGCEYYKKRTVPIIRIKSEDEADYNLYVEYQLNKDRLEQKFGEMLKGVV